MPTRLRAVPLALAAVAILAVAAGGPVRAAGPGPVNINTASAAELASLRGIGPVKAQAIVDYREAHGPFQSVDDLKLVRGIGPRLLDDLRPRLTVGKVGAGRTALDP